MQGRVPIIDNEAIDEEYDLDDEIACAKLHLNPKDLKIADMYVHYQRCRHAVIEFKTSSLHSAIEQIESTIRQLRDVGRDTDIPIVVAKTLSSAEERRYRRHPTNHTLIDSTSRRPCEVRAGSQRLPILLFYRREVDQMYDGTMRKYVQG